jgi:23S rRNA (cytosine1962-C5)-methyltransferase
MSTPTLPTVILKPGEADRIIAGHPWIYHGSVMRLTHPAADGELVQVKDHRQRLIGVGFYNSKSKINVRVLSPERIEVNKVFFLERIRAALAVRQRHLPDATSFRVVNAESDFLSGLILDKYEDVFVLQTSSLGMDQRKAMIVKAVIELFKPRAIVERNEVASRKFEGLPDANGVLYTSDKGGDIDEGGEGWKAEMFDAGAIRGTAGGSDVAAGGDARTPGQEVASRAGSSTFPVTISLNGLKFETDLLAGHKTGLYLDQQVNYRLVAQFAKDAEVLDCFSFLGGFALHAARAGAAHVHLVDQSAEAIAAATRNAAANGLSDRCTYEAANVFDWLKAATAVRPHERVVPRFDLIILDPPSFTRNRASVPDALRGYKEIHLRALKLLKVGGVLASFCCSHHVDAGLFQDTLLSAAYDARRVLRRVAAYTQSPDHPIIPMIPETEYLKGFAYELVR